MHIPHSHTVIGFALQTIELARPLVVTIERRDRDLASQVRRALSSVVLNLAEGFGSTGGNARLRFATARGSLCEALAGLRVAVAWGYFTSEDAAAVLAALDTPGARVYGLARR